MPGPGRYDTPSKVGEGPKYHIGIKTIQSSIFVKSDFPGPGAYAPT